MVSHGMADHPSQAGKLFNLRCFRDDSRVLKSLVQDLLYVTVVMASADVKIIPRIDLKKGPGRSQDPTWNKAEKNGPSRGEYRTWDIPEKSTPAEVKVPLGIDLK